MFTGPLSQAIGFRKYAFRAANEHRSDNILRINWRLGGPIRLASGGTPFQRASLNAPCGGRALWSSATLQSRAIGVTSTTCYADYQWRGILVGIRTSSGNQIRLSRGFRAGACHLFIDSGRPGVRTPSKSLIPNRFGPAHSTSPALSLQRVATFQRRPSALIKVAQLQIEKRGMREKEGSV